ncbi:MAG: hypothetical protein JO103_12600 [Candidatus Eremiobacteraeota bacterium]|nr:hypothetical protein [Candidatus Eremiobacteraeota bacterium]
MHHPADDESPAEEIVRELGLDPSLGGSLDDDPLLRQARENVAETAERARRQHGHGDDHADRD